MYYKKITGYLNASATGWRNRKLNMICDHQAKCLKVAYNLNIAYSSICF